MLRKIFIVILGIIFVLFILEFSINFIGIIFKEVKVNSNNKNNQIIVVCLGESMTALGGMNSYPSQLEKILNSSGGQYSFKVINLALPMTNSLDMVKIIFKDLNKYNPNIVVAMLGINDKSFKYYEKLKWDISKSKLKIFKFFSILIEQFLTKIKENVEFFAEEKNIQKEISLNPNNPDLYIRLFLLYEKNKNFELAEKTLIKAVENFPEKSILYILLSDLYSYNEMSQQAEDILNKKIKITPNDDLVTVKLSWINYLKGDKDKAFSLIHSFVNRNTEQSQTYVILGRFYKFIGDKYQASLNFKKALQLNINNTEAKEEMELIDSLNYLNNNTNTSYKILYNFLSSNKVKSVFVGYPLRDVSFLKEYYKNKEDVAIVDNKHVFEEAISKDGLDKYFIDMFAGDFGHCTKKGNNLLAENIAVSIREFFRNK